MKTKLVIGAIVAIIVIAGIWFYLKSKKEGQQTTGSTKADAASPGPTSSPQVSNPLKVASPILIPSSPKIQTAVEEKITYVPPPSLANKAYKSIGKTVSSTPVSATSSATPASQASLTKILRAKKWRVGTNIWTGDYLNIEVLPDGSAKIGFGYRGKVVDMNTIVTKERYGQASTEIVWKAL